MKLIYNPSKNRGVRSFYLDNILISQGNNNVPDSVKEHRRFDILVESGAFELSEKPVAEKATKTKPDSPTVDLGMIKEK